MNKPFKRSICIEWLLKALVLFCSITGCLHDLDYPLSNNIPVITEISSKGDSLMVLFHPESTLCTLSIADYNDSILIVDSTTWPGKYTLLNSCLDEKRLVFYLDTNLLGYVFEGECRIIDEQHAGMRFPYSVVKQFKDPFDAYPLTWWGESIDSDSIGYMRFYSPISKVQFFFPDTNLTDTSTIALTSKFGLTGDFKWSINYWIRNDMLTGFRLGFRTTTSRTFNDPDGQEAGLNIVGDFSSLSIEYFDNNVNSYIGEVGRKFYYGPVWFIRSGWELHIIHESIEGEMDTLTQFPQPELIYDVQDTVFIHIFMSVSDYSNERFGTLFDFTVYEGEFCY
ncbi:MAG: hypothetical protein GF401_08510 [Chitinivibrionales bacterium]|nr:hypothetical protein [Chitinivibrionales bacterium]